MLPEALHVAREHCDWCARLSMSPLETLHSLGLTTRRGHIPSWEYVEDELALQWMRIKGEINLRKKGSRYTPIEEWREAA
jgi:hypothetical protein